MCRRLNNPKRFDFLVRLYRDDRPMDLAGLNVTGASDGAKVNLSATSEYLKGLAEIGLIRRDRVKEHVDAILTKIGAANRTEAVVIAIRKHLLKI